MATTNRESNKPTQTLRDFQGVNTRNYRTVIHDNQFAWLENVMPVGSGNLVAVPGPGVSLASFPTTCYFMQAVNLNNVDLMIGFGANGAGYSINLTTYAVATFAAAGTFQGSGTSLAQWQNTAIVIVDPTKGYFTWDGTTLTNWVGTLQSLSITAIGTGYTSQPTVHFSTGSAAATCDIQIGLASLSSAGSGYAVGDILTFAGGTFNTAGSLKVATVNGSGAITGINLNTTGDYTAAPTNPVSVTGGYGTGATFTLNFGIGPVTLTNVGSGYTGGVPLVTLTGGGGTGGAITAVLTAVPSGGTAVATYSGRVWVASGRTIAFTAPNANNDFSSINAGGSFIMSDETLHSTITGLIPANNYLYIFGTSSIDIVSDVSVVSGATVMSRSNLTASVGTSDPYSLSAYYRGIWFSTPYGFYALYGSTTSKASDDLDGALSLLNSSMPVSSGSVMVNKILLQSFLFKYNDPAVGARSLLALFFDKKWYFSSQGSSLSMIATSLVGGQPTLYGTDGVSLYKLFSDTVSLINQTIVTKLWDMGKPILNKQSFKFGIEINTPATPQTLSGTIDTESVSNSYPWSLAGGNEVAWINQFGAPVTWTNSSLATVGWVSAGYAFQAIDVGTVGKYLGATINATSPGTTYSGIHLQYEDRAAW